MSILTPDLLYRILDGYRLPVEGYHGLSHWARVLENGRRLAEVCGADQELVEYFAVFHDARRVNEAVDPGHGTRGAELAAQLRGEYFDLDDARFELLVEACKGHTSGRTQAPLAIQVCWDADRLDLYRVGIRPHPRFLCTNAARDRAMIEWANERAAARMSPELIKTEWGLSPGS